VVVCLPAVAFLSAKVSTTAEAKAGFEGFEGFDWFEGFEGFEGLKT